MTLREVIDRKPPDLDDRYVQIARLLIGNPEGITREWAERLSGMTDRAFRQAMENVVASGWLPVVADRTAGGKARYRIAGPDETELVNSASREDHARALSLHKRSRGRVQAFQAHHGAGSLFLADVPEELEAT